MVTTVTAAKLLWIYLLPKLHTIQINPRRIFCRQTGVRGNAAYSLDLPMADIIFSSLMASVMSPWIRSFPVMKAMVGFSSPRETSQNNSQPSHNSRDHPVNNLVYRTAHKLKHGCHGYRGTCDWRGRSPCSSPRQEGRGAGPAPLAPPPASDPRTSCRRARLSGRGGEEIQLGDRRYG